MERSSGHDRDLPAPSLIDFSINPIPKFGARTVNITHTYFDANKHIIRSDYGFMPVKNATRRILEFIKGVDLDIREFERQYELIDFHHMSLKKILY
uniref:Uncharacterized protein n=1 Tax=Ditylenchus dipsaci TaxID=166011 RepID=A0A915E5C1_9BILA